MTAIRTPRVGLRAARTADEAALVRLLSDPLALGAVPDPTGGPGAESRPPPVWQQTLAVQVVERVATGEVIGACRLYDLDPRAGIGWFDVHGAPAVHGRGHAFEGCLLFLEWGFRTWDLRWLCVHTLRTNLLQFASIESLDCVQRLGTLRERVIVDGVPEDVDVFGVSREAWYAGTLRRRLLATIARGSAGA